MKIDFTKIAWSGLIIYVLVMISLHRYPDMPNKTVSTGDFANILVGFVAIATLVCSVWDRDRENIKRNSTIAPESYVNSLDDLIRKLSDSSLDTDTKFFSIDSCHRNLLFCQNRITEEEHRFFAQSKYETFRTHLQLAYHHLQFEYFMAVPKELKTHYNMMGWSTNWTACSYLLAPNWLKYVAPKSPFHKQNGIASYGNYLCTEDTYICSILSMLIAKPLALKPTSELLDQFYAFRKTCECKLQHKDMETAFENYPSLAAHLMLSYTCSAVSSRENKYPKLSIAAHDTKQKKIWFTFKGTNVQHTYSIPQKLANSKYLRKL